MTVKQASFFAPDLTVIGTIHSPGTLEVEGAVKGDVAVADLVVGAQGRLNARIGAGRLAAAGTVAGTVKARAVAFLQGCRFRGDVEYEALSIDPDSDVEARFHPVEAGSPRMAVLPQVPEAMFRIGAGHADAAQAALARPAPARRVAAAPLSADAPPAVRGHRRAWATTVAPLLLLGVAAAALMTDPDGRRMVEDLSATVGRMVGTWLAPGPAASPVPSPTPEPEVRPEPPAMPLSGPSPAPAPPSPPPGVEAAPKASAIPLPLRPPPGMRAADPVEVFPPPPAISGAHEPAPAAPVVPKVDAEPAPPPPAAEIESAPAPTPPVAEDVPAPASMPPVPVEDPPRSAIPSRIDGPPPPAERAPASAPTPTLTSAPAPAVAPPAKAAAPAKPLGETAAEADTPAPLPVDKPVEAVAPDAAAPAAVEAAPVDDPAVPVPLPKPPAADPAAAAPVTAPPVNRPAQNKPRSVTSTPDAEGCVWVVQCSDSGSDAGKCVSTRQCAPK